MSNHFYDREQRMPYRPFKEARAWARKLKLKSFIEWRQYTGRPDFPQDIPICPAADYRGKGFSSFDDFLGIKKNGRGKRGRSKGYRAKWRSYEEARKWAIENEIKTSLEWQIMSRNGLLPADIPSNPSQMYKDAGWLGWRVFLSNESNFNSRRGGGQKWRSFEEAREFVHTLKLKRWADWLEYVRTAECPRDIPACPNHIYKGQWVSVQDWLGYERRQYTTSRGVSDKYRPFEEARAWARSLGLRNAREWVRFSKTPEFPSDVPRNPWNGYSKAGWLGYGDWLGTGNTIRKRGNKTRLYVSYDEAFAWVRSVGITNKAEWKQWRVEKKLPANIPAWPEAYYQRYEPDKWQGFETFLGYARWPKFLPYEEAQRVAIAEGIKGQIDYRTRARNKLLPDGLPGNPANVYAKTGWTSWGDFLKTGNVATRDREYLPFAAARAWVQMLGLDTAAEWREYTKSKDFPSWLPKCPGYVYRDKGWKGYPDFLGTGIVRSPKGQGKGYVAGKRYRDNKKQRLQSG